MHVLQAQHFGDVRYPSLPLCIRAGRFILDRLSELLDVLHGLVVQGVADIVVDRLQSDVVYLSAFSQDLVHDETPVERRVAVGTPDLGVQDVDDVAVQQAADLLLVVDRFPSVLRLPVDQVAVAVGEQQVVVLGMLLVDPDQLEQLAHGRVVWIESADGVLESV